MKLYEHDRRHGWHRQDRLRYATLAAALMASTAISGLAGPGLADTAQTRRNGDEAAAAAAKTRGQDGDGFTLDTVTLKTRNDQEGVYSKAGSSVEISGEELARYGSISAGDALRGQPGVQVGDSRNGGALDVNIRGIQGQSRVAVTIDGSQQALDVYRGYAGTQQRSYFDPELISDITVQKGPGTSATGGIGGSVAMTTLQAGDILQPGKTFGIRLKGELWNNGLTPPARGPGNAAVRAMPRKDRGNLLDSDAKAGSIAMAWSNGRIELVGAYARREQGNYFSGSNGREGYRKFDEDEYERRSVAKVYGAGQEILNSSSSMESALLKATIRPDDAQTLEFSYRHLDAKNGEIMPSKIVRGDASDLQQDPLGTMQINSASMRYAYDPGSNLLDLKANLWWTDAKSNQLNGIFGPRMLDVGFDRFWVRLRNERVGVDVSNRSVFGTDMGDFAVDLGAAFQYETIAPQKSVVTTQVDREVGNVGRDGWRTEFNLSGKVEYKPNPALQFWAGARYGISRSKDRNGYSSPIKEKGRILSVSNAKGDIDYMFWRKDKNGEYSAETDPRLTNGIVFSDTNRPLEGVRANDYGIVSSKLMPGEYEKAVGYSFDYRDAVRTRGFTPSLGVSWQISPETMVYASYTEAYRFPSLFDTTIGTPLSSPVLGLKPERAKSFEIGLSTTRDSLLSDGDTASFKLAYFNNKVKNFITRSFDPNSRLGLMNFRNADSFNSSGIELQSHYDNGRIFADLSATRYLRVETCDKVLAQTLRDRGNRYRPALKATPNCTPGGFQASYVNAQNPPKYAVNLTLGTRLMDDRLTIGGRVTHTSGPASIAREAWQIGSTVPQIVYRPVTLVDAFMSYDLGQNAVFSASVNNLTDRYYLDPLAQSFMPAPGRTVRAALTVKF